MKRTLDEGTVKSIYKALLERFGEPIGKAVDVGPGVPDEKGGHLHRGEDPGNHGFGANLDEAGEQKKRVVACPSCHASGKVNGRGTYGQPVRMVCPACRGRGFIDVKPSTTEAVQTCSFCGTMPSQLVEGPCCDQCGMMQGELDQGPGRRRGGPGSEWDEGSLEVDDMIAGRKPWPKKRTIVPNVKKPEPQGTEKKPEEKLDEKTPPGREKQVKALKKDKDIDNPWAVAWASYNKSH